MNPVIMTAARRTAVQAVKRELQSKGVKIAYVENRTIILAARDYLRDHPELIEEATESVRKVPQLRTLAERHERNRKGNQR